jgi:type I restriction enzyme S subunit
MSNDLPNGWAPCQLADISIKGTQRKPDELESFKYVDIGSINRDKKIIENPQLLQGVNAPSRARKEIYTGDVIVSLTRPNLNAVALVSEKFNHQIASTGFEVIKPIFVDSLYVFSLVRSMDFINSISGVVQGALYPAAKSTDVQKYKFNLPPLAEQKEIVALLEKLMAQAESTKTRLDAILVVLKRFRKSVLATAVNGKLTQEWREENPVTESSIELKERWLRERKINFELSQQHLITQGIIKRAKKFKEPVLPDLETSPVDITNDWETVSVSEFSECLDNIRIPVKKEQRESSKGLYPYFGANGEVDRVDEFLFDDDLVMVTEDETFYGRTKPIAYRYTGKCWVNNHVHVLKAPTENANNFLCYSLMYFQIIPWLSGTTGRAKLTQGALNSVPIGLPTEKEQAEIVRRVEELFAYADKVEAQVNAAQQRVNNLIQSLLTKAFSGELTAKWRAQNPDLITGENSAAALLEKIKAERSALAAKKKPAKKTTARKAKA